jgi:polyferredoxin
MRTMQKKAFEAKNFIAPLILLSFWFVAIVLWRTTGKLFYLFNFGYIGAAVGIGIGLYTMLPRKKKPIGRRVAQLLVGIYLLVFLGLLMKENMQLEGFFFHLLAGFFASSVIHYLVAKFFGPLLYGRAYCSWACWTAMILDFLPYKRNKRGRAAAKWGSLRYVHFGLSLLLILVLWFLFRYRPDPRGQTALVWMIGGNILYYSSAVILAFALKDNRAFCKYLCPITTILKITSRFALLKIEGDKEKCTECGACNKACPMDVNISEYVSNGKRVLSTECIFCLTCTTVCPEGILDNTFRLDIGGKENMQRK